MFVQGDVVVVTRRHESGWWEGCCVQGARRGWFPSNHVELVDAETIVLDEAARETVIMQERTTTQMDVPKCSSEACEVNAGTPCATTANGGKVPANACSAKSSALSLVRLFHFSHVHASILELSVPVSPAQHTCSATYVYKRLRACSLLQSRGSTVDASHALSVKSNDSVNSDGATVSLTLRIDADQTCVEKLDVDGVCMFLAGKQLVSTCAVQSLHAYFVIVQ
jgi:hypothetical protein